MTITAAADGSALGNPGPAGWAWYIDEDTWRAGGWPHGTNNMGELMAVLDLLRSTASAADEPLLILCDSQYVINSITKWMPGWKRKGWRKKDGKPVLNVELMQDIDAAMAGRAVTFEWVKGHAGHALNEAADRRANAAATAFSQKRAPQEGPGFRGAAPAPAAPARTPAPSRADASPRATSRTRAAVEPSEDLFSHLPASPEPPTPVEDVVAREQALLSDRLRSDPAAFATLLHPDFSEIGASGRIYDRARMLRSLAPLAGVEAADFVTEEIAPGVILLTFTTSSPDAGRVRRSSIWVRADGQYLLRHHQGTVAP